MSREKINDTCEYCFCEIPEEADSEDRENGYCSELCYLAHCEEWGL